MATGELRECKWWHSYAMNFRQNWIEKRYFCGCPNNCCIVTNYWKLKAMLFTTPMRVVIILATVTVAVADKYCGAMSYYPAPAVQLPEIWPEATVIVWRGTWSIRALIRVKVHFKRQKANEVIISCGCIAWGRVSRDDRWWRVLRVLIYFLSHVYIPTISIGAL